MKIKYLSALFVVTCLVGTASAQEAVCYGFNCEIGSGEMPDILATYTDLASINSSVTSDMWMSMGSFQQETVEECMARCDQDFQNDIAMCGSQSSIDDEILAQQALLNCANAASQVHTQCLAPVSFMNCMQ